jgi:hypothetical protein
LKNVIQVKQAFHKNGYTIPYLREGALDGIGLEMDYPQPIGGLQ